MTFIDCVLLLYPALALLLGLVAGFIAGRLWR